MGIRVEYIVTVSSHIITTQIIVVDFGSTISNTITIHARFMVIFSLLNSKITNYVGVLGKRTLMVSNW